MTTTKRRRAFGIGATLAAAAAFTTLASGAVSANSDVTPPAGITVPADPSGVPASLVASLEGRNEVTGGASEGQALGLFGIHDNTLTFAISWRDA